MKSEYVKAFRSASHAVQLRDLLSCQLGVDADVYNKVANGSASEVEIANTTVLRYLFGETLSEPHEISANAQGQALLWLRRQKIGRIVNVALNDIIVDTRFIYETTQASESTRLLLLAYKRVKDILYDKETGEVICLPKQ